MEVKKPEELAEKYADDRCGKWEECERDAEWEEAKRGYRAGYQDGYQAGFESCLKMREQLHRQQSAIGAYSHVAPCPDTFISGGTNVEWIPGHGWRQKI